MNNIPLVEDLFVSTLEWMMKQKDVKDLMDYEVVLALYTISHCADVMFDEIAEDDLPESLIDGYRAVRSSLSELVDGLEQYRDDKKETFMSACED